MLFGEYHDKLDALNSAIDRIRREMLAKRCYVTSPEYHKLRKEQKRLERERRELVAQYWE